jgi:hypothetical protein
VGIFQFGVPGRAFSVVTQDADPTGAGGAVTATVAVARGLVEVEPGRWACVELHATVTSVITIAVSTVARRRVRAGTRGTVRVARPTILRPLRRPANRRRVGGVDVVADAQSAALAAFRMFVRYRW